jgi:transposase
MALHMVMYATLINIFTTRLFIRRLQVEEAFRQQ